MTQPTEPKVFVTGATGFIGGWIVEAMHLSGRYTPIAALRRWGPAVRIARFAPEMRFADILKPETLVGAMAGCDYVVHAAVGDDNTTIQGTRNVIAAAQAAGIKRVVHLSTISVYGNGEGVFTETMDFGANNTAYGDRKIKAEEIALSANNDAMHVSALRPTIVYGPFSTQWTVNFAQRILSGKWGTFGEKGEGTCNLVYVGDVVRAVFAALESDAAGGKAFNVNGPEIITWNEYFTQFAAALGQPALCEINLGSNKLKAQMMMPVRSLGKYMIANHKAFVMKMYKSNRFIERLMQSTESGLKLTPTPEQLELYARKSEFPNDRAIAEIGYVPTTDVQTGLRMSVAWLRHHGLAPEDGISLADTLKEPHS